jgi:Protein of unknown function (DUF3073)
MGRGRAKAKQQKVARELKYNSHFTDLDALQRELGGGPQSTDVDDVNGDEPNDGDDWARSGS